MTEPGQPIGYFYGYKTDGVFQTQEEIDNYKNNGQMVMPPWSWNRQPALRKTSFPRERFFPLSLIHISQLRDTLSTSRSVGRGTGAFIYLPPFSENSSIFCSFPFAKIQLVFLPEQTGCIKHRTPFSPSATVSPADGHN